MNFIQKINELKPDFSWTEDNENYDVEKNERNPYDCKDELEKQWNGKLVPSTPEEGSTKRMREAKQKMVQSVRNMMNAGCRIDVIKARIAKNNKKEIVALFQPDIDKQLKLYGSVGRFILDARGYGSCKEAWASTVKNPYRKYFGYVLGCGCHEHAELNQMPGHKNQDFKLSESRDMVASCLESDTEHKSYKACIPTSLVVIAGAGDIDEKWAGNTMIDIMNACSGDNEGNEESVKKITASCDKPYDKLKKFFIAFEQGEFQTEERFIINPEDVFTTTPQEIEIPESEVQIPDIEIPVRNDKINLYDDLERVEVGDMDGNSMDIDLAGEAEPVVLSGGDIPSIEIDISENESGLEGIGNEDVDMGFSSPKEINIPEQEGNIQVGFSEGLSEDIQVSEEEPLEIQF